ncbi:hypothetical protein CDD81_4663 [Ophiocordyceps australis]|uniref:CCHC-type domain-containing protein n=1 Tax=Ophiocordyceps australis TaxID=1399860 RepID=A0A2C5XTP6_9HYPO|nr:hypothetical protein CDD81_4663 [Ophiocordyceps australis]
MSLPTTGQPTVEMTDAPATTEASPELIAKITADVRSALDKQYSHILGQLEKEFFASQKKLQDQATAQIAQARSEVLSTAATGAPTPQDFFRAVGQDPFSRAELTRAIGHGGNPDNLPLRNGPQPEATNTSSAAKKEVLARRRHLAWPVWSGKPEEFPLFLRTLVMRYDADAEVGMVGTQREVWLQLLQCLPSSLHKKVESFWMNGGPNGEMAAQSFFEYLSRTFGTIQYQKEAQAKLRTLRQKEGQLFADFWPELDDTISRAAGSTPWADDAKLSWLHNAMSPQLRELLVTVVMPENWDDYVQRLQTIAYSFEQTARFQKARRRFLADNGESPNSSAAPNANPAVGSSSQPKVDSEGDVIMGATRTQRNGRRGGRGGQQQSTAANSTQRTAKWASAEDRQKRRESGRCIRCGDSTHFIAKCPYKPAVRPGERSTRMGATSLSGPELAEEEDEGEDREQGKE